MMNFFKDKIASYVIDKKLEKIEQEHGQTNFTKFFSSSFSFFVIMPADEKDFHHCFDVLNFLDSRKKVVTMFTYDFKVSLLPLKFRNNVIVHGVQDANKLNLPAKSILDKLDLLNFDASIDLNRNEDLYSGFIANVVKASVRIGFKKSGADRFYNIQIVNNEEDSDLSYKNLVNCLRMF